MRDKRRVGGALRAPVRHALLALLASDGLAGISAERTRELLGGERDPSSDSGPGAGAAIDWQEEVEALRATLGDEHLALADDVVALDPSTATSDVAEFREAIAAGELERAVQLYQGKFVEGFHLRTAPTFERWLQTRREALASEAAAAMERLAEQATARGEPLAAVHWLRLLAAQQPLNNRIAARLMEALVAAGDREGALRHARFHEALVAERLDLPADADVLSIARALRATSTADGVPVASDPAPPPDEGSAVKRGDPGETDAEMAGDPLRRFRAEVAKRYTIEREIARGGHGVVLLATDVRHRRPVALKVLHADLAAGASTTRFQREIRLVAALQHPNILPLFDSGTAAGVAFFVMPFVHGESLRERLTREGPLPVREAVEIARQVALALEVAHRRGIVHRDIKPENLLLSEGQPVIADFGIACALEGLTDAGLTGPGMVVGTPAYMSPEQGAPHEVVDGRSDQYSLGCVLYEMLTGQPPFSGTSGRELLVRHATVRASAPRLLRSELPPTLEGVVLRALEKRPEARHASMAAMATALEEAAREPLVAVAPRKPHRLAGVMAVVLMALAALLASAAQPTAQEQGEHPHAGTVASPPESEERR